MRHLNIIAVMTVAVIVAICTVAASNAAAAEEFSYSKTGSESSKSVGPQSFTFGVAVVDCSTSEGSGNVTSLKATGLGLVEEYTGCEIVGLSKITPFRLTYNYALPNALVIEKTLEIVDNEPGDRCKIVVPFTEPAIGTVPGELEYINKSGVIEEQTNLKVVKYEITESESTAHCGKAGEKGSTGKIVASQEVKLETGSIEVVRPEILGKSYPLKVSAVGRGTNKFMFNSSTSVGCTEAKFSPIEPEFFNGPTTSLLFNATYGKCELNGSHAAEVKMGSCSYLFAVRGNFIIGNHSKPALCEEKPITVTFGSCEITIGPQDLEKVEYKESAGKLFIDLEALHMKYHSNEGGEGCPKNGEEGNYKGELEVSGHTEAGEPDIVELS